MTTNKKKRISLKRLITIIKLMLLSTVTIGQNYDYPNNICRTDVACDCEYDCEEQSVVTLRITYTNQEVHYCTGTLVSTTKQDNSSKYILTSYHCFDKIDVFDGDISATELDMLDDVVVDFNYQIADCSNPSDPGTGSDYIVGVTYVDGSAETDHVLVELSDNVPLSFEPYFMGWKFEDQNPEDEGAVISHPFGDVKKIAKYNSISDPVAREDYGAGNVKVRVYNAGFDNAGPAAASSGAALISNITSSPPLQDDIEGRFITGLMLKNGNSTLPIDCEYEAASPYFSKFNKAWDDLDLGEHLNPNDIIKYTSFKNTHKSLVGYSMCRQTWYFEDANDLESSVNVNEKDEVGTRTYNGKYDASGLIWTGDNVDILPGKEVVFNSASAVKVQAGFKAFAGSHFKAYIDGCTSCSPCAMRSSSTQDTTTTEVTNEEVGEAISEEAVLPATFSFTLYPNPSTSGVFLFDVVNRGNSGVMIEVIDVYGRVILTQRVSKSSNKIDLSQYGKGIYVIRIHRDEQTYTQKLLYN